MIIKIILVLVVLVNGIFAFAFIRDLRRHRDILKEPGNNIAMAVSSFIIFLLATFGISDFALSASLYPRLGWVKDIRLPGTLNTQCVIPVTLMALIYISSINVGLATLILAIVFQIIGSYIGPIFLRRLPAKTIRGIVICGLIMATVFLLLGKLGLLPSGGTANYLSGGKLVLFTILSFFFGALNNIGVASTPLALATAYALGLSPISAFPIMMGANTFSISIGALQFIRYDIYSRKISMFTSIFGTLGVIVAAFVVKSLDVSALQWVVIAILIYSSVTMLMPPRKKKATPASELA